MGYPRVLPVGDAAATVELGDDVSATAVALAEVLRGDGHAWLLDAVPTLAAVLVRYDPSSISWSTLQRSLLERAVGLREAPPPTGRTVVLAARYDGADLEDVARRTGLTTNEVVTLHAASTYRVQMVGFLPGFAYLGPLPEPLRLPRRDTPRVRIPPGSIAVADRFTAVYPSASPGGWHLLGTVRDGPVLWDPHREPPCTLEPGDLVRFAP